MLQRIGSGRLALELALIITVAPAACGFNVVTASLDGAPRRVALHRRADLVHGTTFDGPCVIAQDDTTTIVPDGYAGAVDRFGNLILTRGS